MFRAIAIAVALAASPVVAEDTPRLISVTGQGEVSAQPDMATVTVGARHEAGTAAEALKRTSMAVENALSVLEGAGVEARDMQTRGVSLSPRWARANNDVETQARIVGYIASNDLVVRVRDLDDLGRILDAVVSEGANTLGGVSFGLQDPDTVQNEARRLAVIDARNTAAILAEAAGVELGAVHAISEGGSAMPQSRMRMEAAMSDASVPIAPGELTVSAQVSVLYRLDD